MYGHYHDLSNSRPFLPVFSGDTVMRDSSTGSARRIRLASQLEAVLSNISWKVACSMLVAAFALTSAHAQQVTFAGALTTVPATGLFCPRGVAVDTLGDVFIANSNHSQIIEVPAGGGAEFTVGSGFNGPNGVMVTKTGNLFIGDSRNNRVVEIPANGGAQFDVGTGLKYPGGLAINNAGDLFIADTNNKRVVEVPAGGGGQITLSSNLRYPDDVALDASGNLYITDTGAGKIIEIPAGGGAPTTLPTTGLHTPSGVVVDAGGDVFISDSANGRVVELPAGGGAQTTVCGSEVAACNGLTYPYGLAVDGSGDLFIVDHSGTVGTCPEPGSIARAIELQRTQVNFGNVNMGSNSTLTLHYNVAETTKFGAIQIVGAADFTVGAGSTCAGTVDGSDSCVVNINFSPGARGLRQGQIQLADNTGEVLATTSIQGVGMAASATTITSSVDPSNAGEAVTFTAAVSSGDGAIPDGETVRFMDGITILGVGTLAHGSASFTTSALKAGTTQIKAAYGGDTNFAASTSAAVIQRVKPGN
jgi:sugar lactone lactonase YvrE